MKKFLLKSWYLAWISQYNNKYSRKSLEKIIKKVKKNIKDDVYRKIDISDISFLYFDSIFELIIVLDVFISGYKDYINFNPNAYLRAFPTKTNLLDFFTLDKGQYKDPKSTMNVLIDKLIILMDLIDKDTNKSIRKNKEKFAEQLFKDSLLIIEFYFIKLIDGEDIKKNF